MDARKETELRPKQVSTKSRTLEWDDDVDEQGATIELIAEFRILDKALASFEVKPNESAADAAQRATSILLTYKDHLKIDNATLQPSPNNTQIVIDYTPEQEGEKLYLSIRETIHHDGDPPTHTKLPIAMIPEGGQKLQLACGLVCWLNS